MKIVLNILGRIRMRKQLHFEFEYDQKRVDLIRSKIDEASQRELIKGIAELYLKFILTDKEEGRKNERGCS